MARTTKTAAAAAANTTPAGNAKTPAARTRKTAASNATTAAKTPAPRATRTRKTAAADPAPAPAQDGRLRRLSEQDAADRAAKAIATRDAARASGDSMTCVVCAETKLITSFPTTGIRADGTMGRGNRCRACRDAKLTAPATPAPAPQPARKTARRSSAKTTATPPPATKTVSAARKTGTRRAGK